MLRALMVLFLAGLAAACSPLHVLNSLVPEDGYELTADIAYGDDPRQKLDIFRPREPGEGKAIVVFFYGGSWKSGSRADYKFVGEALASRGMVAVLADYRLYPQVTYPDFLVDSARAVAWARRHAAEYGASPDRLYVMGHSAGAYNAAMLALDPRWLSAEGMAPSQLAGWIGLAGPYDFFPATSPEVQSVFHHPAYPTGAQPIEHVSGRSPPVFLAAARSDSVVDPQRNTRRLAAVLEAAGVPVTLKVYEHVNHITLAAALSRPLRPLAPVLDEVRAFVNGP